MDIYSDGDKDAYNLTKTITDIMILYCSIITFLTVVMGLLLCIYYSYTILNFLAVMECMSYMQINQWDIRDSVLKTWILFKSESAEDIQQFVLYKFSGIMHLHKI